MTRGGYINVDQLQAATSLDEAAAMCGVTLDAYGDGHEVRLDCPFACEGDHAGRREIAVNTDNEQKVFMCHAYQCGFRGNLLSLMHGWLTGTRPTGDKLKGDEFHRVKNVLASGGVADNAAGAGNSTSISDTASNTSRETRQSKSLANGPKTVRDGDSPTDNSTHQVDTSRATARIVQTTATATRRNIEAASKVENASTEPRSERESHPERNIPLGQSDDEKVRELTSLDEKFVIDVAAMPPAAASYVRRHPCLTPDSMAKWLVGVLPMDGGADKRGFSLRGQVTYPVQAEDGQVLAWIGRDPKYEDKERDFARLTPAERADATAPMKHRFPKGFHRGLELFGQQASRLQEPGYREAIARHGLIVVEGFNDVIQLDNLSIPALAIMSNRITEPQADKLTRWSQKLANNKITLLFDCEPTGDEGAKEALWLLTQRGIHVQLAWSQSMHNGEFQGRQPENLTREEWEQIMLIAHDR